MKGRNTSRQAICADAQCSGLQGGVAMVYEIPRNNNAAIILRCNIQVEEELMARLQSSFFHLLRRAG